MKNQKDLQGVLENFKKAVSEVAQNTNMNWWDFIDGQIFDPTDLKSVVFSAMFFAALRTNRTVHHNSFEFKFSKEKSIDNFIRRFSDLKLTLLEKSENSVYSFVNRDSYLEFMFFLDGESYSVHTYIYSLNDEFISKAEQLVDAGKEK